MLISMCRYFRDSIFPWAEPLLAEVKAKNCAVTCAEELDTAAEHVLEVCGVIYSETQSAPPARYISLRSRFRPSALYSYAMPHSQSYY
jgi:hypothetical protein